MLDFNKEFRDGTSKITKVWLNLTLSDGTALEFHEDRVLMNGLVRDSSTTVDGEFTVGAAVTGKLSVSLDNSDASLSGYDFRGATIVAWLGGTLSDGTMEKVNIGRYYVDEYTYNGVSVDLVAYDDMSKFDKALSITISGNTSLASLVGSACRAAGITLYGELPAIAKDFKITQLPEQQDTMTWHDVISYAAQIMCCFAHIVYVPSPGDYRLKFEWYNVSQMTVNQYDGGSFDTNTTPYSDGATLNGGTFNPWTDGDSVDGGAFGDREAVHVIGAPYDMTIDTDDVLITGVSVVLDPSDNINADNDTKTYTKTLGEAGYIIQISGNPLIETKALANTVCQYLHDCLVGMRFRPLSASCVENPSMEAGDVALVADNIGNTYSCFLSRVTYTVNAATHISCDAASTMQNLKARYSGAQKTQALMQRTFEKSVSSAEAAMSGIMGALSNTMGLYDYSTIASSGKIYLFGNNSTLETSNIRWRFSAGSFAVSKDYGQHWVSAFSSDGRAVLQEVYAVKVNADFIETGTLTVGGSDKGVGTVYIKDENDVTLGIIDDRGVYYGKLGINDTTNTGFFLSKDGLIIGDGTSGRYIRITPDGTTYIHDSYAGETETPDPSFIVEGADSSGFTRRSYITPTEIVIGERVGGSSFPFMADSQGNVVATGNFTNQYGKLIATDSSNTNDLILTMGVEERGSGVVTTPYLNVSVKNGMTYGVDFNGSDIKLKKDIHDSTVNALDAINRIEHRAFTWKHSGLGVKNGYIAQELEEVIPGSTYDVDQGDGSAIKQIRLLGVVPYLSKAIQELSAKVDALEARLEELEGR